MTYSFKRAIGIAFCLYIATFVVGVICTAVSGMDTASMTSFPDYYWYVSMVAALVFTFLFANWYFKNTAITPSAKSGFWFGLTAVALSTLLDYVLFTVGNMTAEQKFDIGSYYGDYRFWVIVVLVILTAKLVGHFKKSKVATR